MSLIRSPQKGVAQGTRSKTASQNLRSMIQPEANSVEGGSSVSSPAFSYLTGLGNPSERRGGEGQMVSGRVPVRSELDHDLEEVFGSGGGQRQVSCRSLEATGRFWVSQDVILRIPQAMSSIFPRN